MSYWVYKGILTEVWGPAWSPLLKVKKEKDKNPGKHQVWSFQSQPEQDAHCPPGPYLKAKTQPKPRLSVPWKQCVLWS